MAPTGKKTKKRSLMVIRTIESFYPRISGPANQAFAISNELEKRGIHSPVLTSDYEAMTSPSHQRIDKVEVSRFPIMFRIMKYFYTPGMKKRLTGFDIVHAHSHRSYQTAAGYRAAKKSGKPFVISAHGSVTGYRRQVKGAAKLPYIIYDLFGGKRIVKEADAVVANSKAEYEELIKYGVDRKRLHLIPAGINTDEYSPLPKDEKTTTVLFVGRISRDRRVELIIQAAALLKRQKKPQDVRFVIVGGEARTSDMYKAGYLEEMRQLARKLGVADTVRFTGEKRGKELRRMYRTADIFAYTSVSENFGQTILEAGAAGLPIICTRVGIAPEIINDGKNGYLVKGEPKEIADRITLLLDKKRRNAFGEKTRAIVKSSFGWDRIIDSYISLYNTISKQA